MTITGQIGHMGVGIQAAGQVAEASVAAFTPTLTNYFIVTEESMVAEAAPLMAENEIGRGRDRTGAVAAGYGISGGFGGYGRASDLGYLTQMAVRQTLVTGGGPLTVVPEDYLAWYTVEKNVGDTLYLWLINCKMNSLTVTVGSNAISTWTADFVAALEVNISGEATPHYSVPSYVGDDLLAFHGGLIEIGGAAYNNMESIEVAINNNLSNDEFTVRQSRFLNNVTEGQRTIDLNFSQVFQDAADYATYTYGAPGRTTPGYSLFEDDVMFLMGNAQSKGTATQYIEYTFPRVMFGGIPVNLTNGRIVVSNTGVVLAPAADDIMSVEYL
jgi:hypothetical protein